MAFFLFMIKEHSYTVKKVNMRLIPTHPVNILCAWGETGYPEKIQGVPYDFCIVQRY
jgi:hypothetical protein